MSKQKRITVSEYLTQQINISGKSQREIADDVGYEMPNVITMMKQGKTKLPINKVPLFAKSLGVDPVHLLRIVMIQYMPDTWEILDALIGKSMVSEPEAIMLDVMRTVGQGQNVGPETEEDTAEFAAMVEKWRVRDEKRADAARRRKEKEKGTSVA